MKKVFKIIAVNLLALCGLLLAAELFAAGIVCGRNCRQKGTFDGTLRNATLFGRKSSRYNDNEIFKRICEKGH